VFSLHDYSYPLSQNVNTVAIFLPVKQSKTYKTPFMRHLLIMRLKVTVAKRSSEKVFIPAWRPLKKSI